jgi:chitodextrinase
MKRQIISAVLLLLGSILTPVLGAGPAGADVVICEKYGSTPIQGGRYVVQNNNWGDDTTQCINVTDTGFSVTTASHDKPQNGAPGSYPSVFAGCHYANCSSGSGLPMQASDSRFNSIQTSVSMSYAQNAGVYDAAYDIWFDPTPRTDGQNTGAELMIWLNHTGSVQPVGSRVGTVNLAGATWDVWFGNIGWNVVSYVRTQSTTSIAFPVRTFYDDAVSRGYAQRSWYLTSVQAGFEPWVGGVGLAVNDFSYSVGGGGGADTTAPSTPTGLSASGVTSNGASLSWSASTDNVGVAGYDVYRSQGGGTFTQVGTASGTSFAATGLSPSTTYSFYVRARDAAGNVSGNSSAVSVTTLSGGGGGGASCRVTYGKTEWPGGFTANVTIANTGTAAVNGWTLTFSFAGDQRVTNAWNAGVTQSGAAVTARNVAHNASIPAGGSTSFGFQGTWSGSNAVPGAFSLNGSACTTA